ncbi:MAG: hypothetical protein KJN70_04845 [Eudoraea sp.]|nr:hypothetical protein [Eudoraea sp.]
MKEIKDRAKNNHKVAFIISLIFLAALIVCLIINYSIENTISWALYPGGGLIVLWATIMPLLVLKKNKVTGLLVGLTLTLIPYIFLIQHLVSSKGWFAPLALPIAIMALIAIGISLFALVNKQTNTFYAVALTIFLFGVLVNIGVAIVVYRYLNETILFDTYRIATISIAVLLSLVLMIIGYNKSKASQHL